MAIVDSISFPEDNRHNSGEDVTYVNKKDKLYVVFNGQKFGTYISEIDPETLSFKDLEMASNFSWPYPSIAADDEYLYFLTNQSPSRVLKIELSGYKIIKSAAFKNCGAGHAIRFDGKDLYATGASKPSWISKIDPNNLSYTCHHFKKGNNTATDDMAFDDKYIYVCLETPNGRILRIEKSNISKINQIDTNIESGCFGTFYDGKYIWAVFNTAPGQLAKIDPDSLNFDLFTLAAGENYPNEIIRFQDELIISLYTKPAKILKINPQTLQIVK